MKNNLILVIGASGYIGNQVVNRCQRQNIQYSAIDKVNAKENKDIVKLNLCNRKRTKDFISHLSPTVIVHCGTNSALAYKNNFNEAFREDAIAISNLLEAISGLPECRLIYFSSSYVYSGLSPIGAFEESIALQPTHNFGIAKIFFEQLVLRCHTNSVIYRLSSVYGPGNAIHPNAIFSMAKECLENGKLTVWGAGSRRMQYVHIDDVLDCVIGGFIIDSGIYNLGGNEYITVSEAANLIADFYSSEVVYLHNKKEGDTLPFMSTMKLVKTLNHKFRPSDDSITKYLQTLL
ncbi:MAG: NAD(P)-dependent oxidoreductase [Bacteroidia bacterium]|nr:NAD(P)-dependent oxidoreductase [Bacteroidia bacterium]